jgi:signal transduction histidine kinase
MRLSLRYRLLLPLTLLLLGQAAATGWAARAAARAAERRLAAQQLAVAETLAASTFPLREGTLRQMKGLSGAEFLLARDARSVESTFPDPKPDPPAGVPIIGPAAGVRDYVLGPLVALGGQEFRALRLPLRPPHPDAGSDVYIFYPESLRRTAIRDAVRPLLILGSAGGLIAVALAVAFGSRLVSRVRDLDARTRLIAAGDFRPMPVPTADDELRDLCESVNDMARRLAAFQEELQRDERLRVLGQFSGGLAHQLRNAAMGAKLAVELFLAENPSADPEPLAVALRQLDRIEANLKQFLTLGRPPATAKQPCDLVALIDQAVSLLRPRCQHAGTVLVWKPPAGPYLIHGDAAQLSHLFGNVIGNAVEAAGPGGTVEIRVRSVSEDFVVEVTDTGPGPPPGIADRLFEPFVTGKDQGIGLGLAVAQQAADAHAGRIAWERREGKTVFRVELPS